MSSIKASLGVPYAKIYEVDELVGAVATKSYTCPANRRWRLLSGVIDRDVSATLLVHLYNDADHPYHNVAGASAGTTSLDIPSASDQKMNYGGDGVLLGPGDYLKITWGATQTNPRVTLRFLEIAY